MMWKQCWGSTVQTCSAGAVIVPHCVCGSRSTVGYSLSTFFEFSTMQIIDSSSPAVRGTIPTGVFENLLYYKTFILPTI